MSLGFIIAVVFAIVLLSLALTWLRGTIDQIMGLSDDLTQEAQSTLRDSFRSTSSSFAVWPSQYSLTPGKELRMSAGIENDATDGQPHKFVINVLPASADSNVLSIECGSTPFSNCDALKDKMTSWATFDTSAGLIQINAVGFKFINVRPSSDAVKGTYIFNVVACYDATINMGAPQYFQCNAEHENLWGGSAQQVLISVV